MESWLVPFRICMCLWVQKWLQNRLLWHKSQQFCWIITPHHTTPNFQSLVVENIGLSTNETGPLPLCTFSVMGLSMCSSIFSESSPVRSKSGIINELSGFPNSVPTVRCSYTSPSWHGHTSHAYCICFVGKH